MVKLIYQYFVSETFYTKQDLWSLQLLLPRLKVSYNFFLFQGLSTNDVGINNQGQIPEHFGDFSTIMTLFMNRSLHLLLAQCYRSGLMWQCVFFSTVFQFPYYVIGRNTI